MMVLHNKISHGFVLLPFFLSAAAYFIFLVPHAEPSFYVATIKCLPIIFLALYVLASPILLGVSKNRTNHQYQIVLGLMFSGIGDLCLVWHKNMFILGMIAFAVGHIFYIKALGFKPMKLHYGIIMYLFGFGMLFVLLKGLKGIFLYAVPVYSVLLATMAWRALSFEANDAFIKMLISMGGVSWAASDAILAYDKFISPLPFAQLLIMSTYYFGQFGITMTILEEKKQKSR